MLTVRDMVEVTGVRVVAGAGGLDRPVRWVHISELQDPTPWLSGGELLLTTGMTVNGDGGDYVDRIASYGLAALGVGVKVGGLETLPEDMVRRADALDFPLLEIPYETPFIALTEKAFSHIAAEQAEMLHRAVAAHDRLERVVLSEAGLDGLVATLAELVGGSAAVCDARGETLAAHGEPDGGLELEVPGDSRVRLLASRDDGPMTELDNLVVHQAVTIVALEMLRRRIAADTERRLAGDVLASLLSGALEGEELRRRLEPFGLTDKLAVIVFPDADEAALDDAVRRETGAGLVARAQDLVCALIPDPGDDFALAERIRAHADGSAGAGRAVAVADARRGFHEARWALEAAALAEDDIPRLFTYRDLGSFQLLLALQDDDALRTFCDSILAPLETDTTGYSTELLRSLEAFIEANGQWERAARTLFCHRHTLRYRIQRVEQLTGRSLDSARDRIDFWLALRGRELLN